MSKYISNIIGQENIKKALDFYIENQRITGICPNMLLTSKRGDGKTTIARSIANNLIDPNGNRKTFIEVNAAEIKNVTQLVDNIILPRVNDTDCTLFIDEVAELVPKIQIFLLSALAPNDDHLNIVSYNGSRLVFNFRRFTFIGATTHPNKVKEALKNRLKRIDLEPYTDKDLTRMLNYYLVKADIIMLDSVKTEIISVIRRSPRTLKLMVDDIVKYCQNNNTRYFTTRFWNDFKNTLNIRTIGLTPTEIDYLRFINSCGPQRVSNICSHLCLDRTTVMNDTENYLVSERLIRIDTKRYLTEKGQEILSKLQRNEL